MARPRIECERTPSGRPSRRRHPIAKGTQEQASYRQSDDEFTADVLAIRTIATPDEYARWLEAECNIDALPERVRVYLKRDQQFREYLRKCQRLQLDLIEIRRQRTADEHVAA